MATKITAHVRAAGYEVVRVEQLRSNRWLLLVKDGDGKPALVLAQQRFLVSSADVQDLAELLRCRGYALGFLLAVDGVFSAEARRTAAELRDNPIALCTDLPHTGQPPQAQPVLASNS